MSKQRNKRWPALLVLFLLATGCTISKPVVKSESRYTPATFPSGKADSGNIALMNWRNYFTDEKLAALIDTALLHNQEYNIAAQEIEIARNEIRARKGEYLPSVNLQAGADYGRESGYTPGAVVKENVAATERQKALTSSTNFILGPVATWEADIWGRLRKAKDAAVLNYLASVEGRRFTQTNLIAEIATSYYELEALDNQLEIINQNIRIQTDAYQSSKVQKEAARITQLAVNRFEAQLLNTKNLQYEVKQKIAETENRIHFLTGVFPENIPRNAAGFLSLPPHELQTSIPARLLENRPDIRQAEYALKAANLNVEVARLNFYPRAGLRAGLGFQAFSPVYLFHPESIIFNLAGDMVAPLINRNALKATYATANAQQIQAVYRYEQSVLNAYTDVLNQLAKSENYTGSFNTKSEEVKILQESVTIANSLFNYARADYIEVLLTQAEALKSKMELVEIKQNQMQAKVNLYRALGGGWQ